MSRRFGAQFLRNAMWTTIRLGGRQMVVSAGFFVFAYLMDPKSFGVAAVATSLGFLARLFVERGITDLVIQMPDEDQGALSTAFWMAMGLGMLTWVLGTATGIVLTVIRHDIGNPLMFFFACSVAPIIALSRVHEGLGRRQQRFQLLAGVQIVSSLVALVAGVVLAMLKTGPWAILAFTVLEGVVLSIVLWMRVRWRPSRLFIASRWKTQAKFSAAVIFSSVLTIGNLRIIELALGVVLGPTSAGFFRLAAQANRVLTQLLRAPVNQVLLPAFARLDSEVEIGARALDVIALSAAITYPAYLISAAVAPEIFVGILGAKWLPAGETAAWLLWAILGHLILPIANSVHLSQARTREATSQAIVLFVSCFALTLLGAAIDGLHGASIGFAASAVVVTPYTFWRLKAAMGVDVGRALRAIAPYGLAAIAANLLAQLVLAAHVFAQPIVQAIFAGGVAAVAYAIVTVILVMIYDRQTGRRAVRMAAGLLAAVRPGPEDQASPTEPGGPSIGRHLKN